MKKLVQPNGNSIYFLCYQYSSSNMRLQAIIRNLCVFFIDIL